MFGTSSVLPSKCSSIWCACHSFLSSWVQNRYNHYDTPWLWLCLWLWQREQSVLQSKKLCSFGPNPQFHFPHLSRLFQSCFVKLRQMKKNKEKQPVRTFCLCYLSLHYVHDYDNVLLFHPISGNGTIRNHSTTIRMPDRSENIDAFELEHLPNHDFKVALNTTTMRWSECSCVYSLLALIFVLGPFCSSYNSTTLWRAVTVPPENVNTDVIPKHPLNVQ